jgi:hypothetical protein
MWCFLASRFIDQASSVNSEKAPLTPKCRGWHSRRRRNIDRVTRRLLLFRALGRQ